MRVTAFTGPPRDNRTYLVVDESSLEAAVIDPALVADKVLKALKLSGATVKYVLNTHGHADHTADDAKMKEATGAKLAIHEVDAPYLERNTKNPFPFLDKPTPPAKADQLLKEGTEVRLHGGRRMLEVREGVLRVPVEPVRVHLVDSELRPGRLLQFRVVRGVVRVAVRVENELHGGPGELQGAEDLLRPLAGVDHRRLETGVVHDEVRVRPEGRDDEPRDPHRARGTEGGA